MGQPAGIVAVIQSFTGVLGAETVLFRAGELVDAAHPAVARWPTNFGPVRIHHPVRSRVEQATAGPGEQRGG